MWNYTPEETTRAVVGDYRCAVADAWEAVSKSSGKNMIVVTVKINGTNVKVNHYFVEGEYFNRNITSFFDSFGIKRGDFNLLGWVGCIGAAKFCEDDQGYTKVKWFLSPEQSEKLPAWEGEVPERQTVSNLVDVTDDDDLPF